MQRNSIPGFGEALSQEQKERNLPYLSRFFEKEVAGHQVPNLTPLLYTLLVERGSPFVVGGTVELGHIAEFVYVVKGLEIEDQIERKKIIFEIGEIVGKTGFDQSCSQIDFYLDVTFRDSGDGKSSGSPIASSCAWMEYRFASDPWRWDRERTLNMPLRILYQQLRCQDKEQGGTVVNKLSREVYAAFLKNIQKGLRDGSITQEDLNKINEINRKHA